MGNQGLKYAALAAVMLAVLLGVLAYRMTLSMSAAAREEAKAGLEVAGESPLAPSTLAIVALRSLAATRNITVDDVALKPVAVVPERYFTKLQDVVGRAPLIDIDAGAPVTPRYFIESNILARLIPEGHQAMSLEISDVVAVGGFVRPGDEVDLLMFIRAGQGPAQSRVLLEKVLVLAYEDRIIERPQGLTKDEGRSDKRSRVRTVVVAIPDAMTTKVMLGASLGEIRLALLRQSVAGAEAEAEAEFDSANPLPPAPEKLAEQVKLLEQDKTKREKVITLNELTQLAAKKTTKPKPRPYVIEVFRGSALQKVND
jgi:pilus assembly protein CpaB